VGVVVALVAVVVVLAVYNRHLTSLLQMALQLQ
jgi:hypothetical protein